ncbi:hypothetical protein E3P94_04147 [Wallemia ichthyophaga]|nr:hypothetical protein E3P95_04146 [Wallemia ichthyophaga]TIA95051.1 hypothetical protein E3P94_04147 [Wallemia ichthyophaga]
MSLQLQVSLAHHPPKQTINVLLENSANEVNRISDYIMLAVVLFSSEHPRHYSPSMEYSCNNISCEILTSVSTDSEKHSLDYSKSMRMRRTRYELEPLPIINDSESSVCIIGTKITLAVFNTQAKTELH